MGLLALMLLHESRRAARTSRGGRNHAARRPGPLAVEPRPDRRRQGAGSSRRWRRGRFGPYTLQAAIAAVHADAANRRGDRLGANCRPVRCARADRAVAGRRAESRGRGRDARWPGGRSGADRRHPGPRRTGRLSPGPRGPGRFVPPAGANRATPVPLTSRPWPWRGRSRSGVFSSGGSANWPEKILFALSIWASAVRLHGVRSGAKQFGP